VSLVDFDSGKFALSGHGLTVSSRRLRFQNREATTIVPDV
jgi:hypothetical protein